MQAIYDGVITLETPKKKVADIFSLLDSFDAEHDSYIVGETKRISPSHIFGITNNGGENFQIDSRIRNILKRHLLPKAAEKLSGIPNNDNGKKSNQLGK